MKKLLIVSILFLNSCVTEFENRSGNSSKLEQGRI